MVLQLELQRHERATSYKGKLYRDHIANSSLANVNTYNTKQSTLIRMHDNEILYHLFMSKDLATVCPSNSSTIFTLYKVEKAMWRLQCEWSSYHTGLKLNTSYMHFTQLPLSLHRRPFQHMNHAHESWLCLLINEGTPSNWGTIRLARLVTHDVVYLCTIWASVEMSEVSKEGLSEVITSTIGVNQMESTLILARGTQRQSQIIDSSIASHLQ